jgi:hypothetical protein
MYSRPRALTPDLVNRITSSNSELVLETIHQHYPMSKGVGRTLHALWASFLLSRKCPPFSPSILVYIPVDIFDSIDLSPASIHLFLLQPPFHIQKSQNDRIHPIFHLPHLLLPNSFLPAFLPIQFPYRFGPL